MEAQISKAVFTELEQRFLDFGIAIKKYCQSLEKDIINRVYINQLIRSSSSIGANYIEANEKLGEKDLLHRIKIARKEAKESLYWLAYLQEFEAERNNELQDEANQIRKILSSMILKLNKT